MEFINKQLLCDLIGDQPCHNGGEYCILKEIIHHDKKYSVKLLMQIKCVDKFKFAESAKRGRDIGWSDAWALWVDLGYAKKFTDEYKSGDTINQLYSRIIPI